MCEIAGVGVVHCWAGSGRNQHQLGQQRRPGLKDVENICGYYDREKNVVNLGCYFHFWSVNLSSSRGGNGVKVGRLGRYFNPHQVSLLEYIIIWCKVQEGNNKSIPRFQTFKL